MKIAFIGQKGIPASWGGVEQHVEKLSQRIADLGNDVIVYNREYYAGKEKTEDFEKKHPKIKIVTLPTIQSKHFDAIVHTFISTLHAIKSGVDVYHYQGVGPSLLSWIPRLLRPRARVVVTFHSPDRLHQKWGIFARTMLTLAEWTAVHFPHTTITVSRSLQSYVQKRYHKNTLYIPNGVLMPDYTPTQNNEKEFGITKGNYILFVSRFIPHKGAHFLIEAFQRIKTDKKLVLVGDSSYTDEYVKKIKKMAAHDPRIVFTGYQTGDALQDLFSNAYLYVQPSESEGLSIAVLEAASYGNAVLASDIDANAEIVEGKGFLFQNANVEDLQKKLEYLLENSDAVKKSGQELRSHVKNLYNWDTIARHTSLVYEETEHLTAPMESKIVTK